MNIAEITAEIRRECTLWDGSDAQTKCWYAVIAAQTVPE